MTLATLNGLYRSDFVADGRQHLDMATPPVGIDRSGAPTRIEDGRALQAGEQLSEADFFERHGFVLLPHASRVRDWDTEVASLYLPEIEAVVRERLFPGRRVEVQQSPSLLRRGRGTATPFYADGVHSDGGLDADDYQHNVAAWAGEDAARWWRMRYDREDVAGLVWIDFWRPTNMAEPLRHMPLALCDAGSIVPDDIVPTSMSGIAPEGRVSRHLALRRREGQRWYVYPGMTTDELLAFKLAEFWKVPHPPQNVFHSAFRDPDAPPDAEERQSCEHRVAVLVPRD